MAISGFEPWVMNALHSAIVQSWCLTLNMHTTGKLSLIHISEPTSPWYISYAVFFNGSIGDWFRTTVGVRQGCLLSSSPFNIFLDRIMTDALDDHEGTVSIGGKTITNLRFVEDIDGLAGRGKRSFKFS